jgi:hypothetical protein
MAPRCMPIVGRVSRALGPASAPDAFRVHLDRPPLPTRFACTWTGLRSRRVSRALGPASAPDAFCRHLWGQPVCCAPSRGCSPYIQLYIPRGLLRAALFTLRTPSLSPRQLLLRFPRTLPPCSPRTDFATEPLAPRGAQPAACASESGPVVLVGYAGMPARKHCTRRSTASSRAASAATAAATRAEDASMSRPRCSLSGVTAAATAADSLGAGRNRGDACRLFGSPLKAGG